MLKPFGLEFRVGLVVLAAMGILFYSTMKLGDLAFFQDKEGYTLRFSLDSAAGLDLKAPIQIAGVDVGRVEQISLQDGKAIIRGRIFPGIKIRKKGVTVSMKSKGLLGEKLLEIIQGSGDEFVSAGSLIPENAQKSDLDSLMSIFSSIAADVKKITAEMKTAIETDTGENSIKRLINASIEITENVNRLIKENMAIVNKTTRNFELFSAELRDETPKIAAKINRIADTLEKFSREISEGRGTVGKLVSTEELYDKLNEFVTSLNKIAKKIELGQGTAGKLINDDGLYTKLDSSLSDINKITARVEAGQGTVGKLINEDKIYEDLSTTLSSVGGAMSKMEKIQLVLRLHNEFLLRNNENKGYFTLDIIPSSSKFYRFEVIDDPRGKVFKRTDRVTVEGVETLTEKIIIKSQLKLSAVIGKRYNSFQIRVGMVENSFGLGGDYFLMRDKLKFSLDAWNFNSNDILEEHIHLKTKFTYKLNNNFRVNTGYDNFLNNKLDSGFLGGEFFFRDDDLKYLLKILI